MSIKKKKKNEKKKEKKKKQEKWTFRFNIAHATFTSQ